MSGVLVGVELRDQLVAAVALDDSGTRVGWAEVPGADVCAASLAALERVAPRAKHPEATLGIAAHDPESPSCRAAIEALASAYGAAGAQQPVVPTGVAAAAAEAWLGAGRDAADLVFFSVAEHVEAGIVRNGAPVAGAHRRAAFLSWLALNPVEREDYRRIGCLEAEVAAAGIVRRLVWRIKAGDRSRVQERVRDDLSAITMDHVLDAARAGDGVSISVVRDTAKYLGMAAANLIVILDPSMLVLGGIMASAADLLLEAVRTEVGRRVPPVMMQAIAIVPASLGAEAAAIGAARLAAARRP